MALGLLIVRLVVGLTMAAHGAQKLFAGLAELSGGLLLALGLATPLAAMLITSVMFVAIATVHIKLGFFNHNQGYEYNLTLAVVAVSVAMIGAGPISVDGALRLQDAGPVWGLAALVAGVAGGAVQLAGRKAAATQKAN